jgi:hypothetical protein
MIYRAKIEKFIERENDLEQGMPKAYSLIYSTCNTHGFPIVTHVRTYGFRRDSHESIHE